MQLRAFNVNIQQLLGRVDHIIQIAKSAPVEQCLVLSLTSVLVQLLTLHLIYSVPSQT